MARLCFDYGHGGEDSGACYKGRKESNDVLSIGKAVAAEVRRHGVTVDETRISDATVSLQARSNFENRNTYDYFISFHRNAFQPEQAKGVETYTYLNGGSKSKGLAEKIQAGLVALGFVNRGVKETNFHVLRETKAPAVLVEIGFIDNSEDNNLFDNKRNEIIRGVAKAILENIGIDYTEASASTQSENRQTLYRVMAGSYSVRENAENQVQKLKAAGFDATIMIFNK
ncbi:N-acetylmuramoyl-L-alanine amidase [Clostridium tyrobutyricum]|jgi:N-acetylmuramoyl-L-alanine amidase|uniref:N-acetylmuramoyl-L-alanine amidase n=1 Tax=Clostridium tyrobutyricum TaxID=1519 RepID=UPI001C38BD40|nr:N-acetylmuramoyl-L-alanine amidase [Clostridium tyrobutyricum]MBV4424280.1 N-acetylmuramoyl-L-alanine amidase [Clostridium tyrobutyricum]